MNTRNNFVHDYMRLSEVFINENDNVLNALEMFKRHNLKRILVIRGDLSILGCVKKSELNNNVKNVDNNDIKNLKIKDLSIKYDLPVFVYPKMGIFDAYSIMKYFNIKYLPVVDAPWEKKIVGFLWIEDILSVIKKNYFKVPVATNL